MKAAIWAAIAGSALIAGCGGAETTNDDAEHTASIGLASQDGDDDPGDSPHDANGRHLFNKGTFGGNGRTCRTCHEKATGALSPASVQARFAADPTEPLFQAIDSDDGVSTTSYDRLRQHATILIHIDLPPFVSLGEDPSARTATFERGVPTTFDKNPVLEPVLMYDTREPDLASQALGAVNAHAQPTVQPTAEQLEDIAEFEAEKLFSSGALKQYANGGPPPELPRGHTAAEQHGRTFVEDVPFDPAHTGNAGVCALCHSGPMLNTTKLLQVGPITLQFAGQRVSTAFVSELNDRGAPLQTFLFALPPGVPVPFLPAPPAWVSVAPDGTTTVAMLSPDPGVSLIPTNPIIHGDPAVALQGVNIFKIPTLWGVKDTAPYFHDNSAATLEALMDHYNRFFSGPPLFFPPLSAGDQADIVAYLKLL